MLPGLKPRFAALPIDLIIFRENTEDLYSGIEHEVVTDVVESLKVITKVASMKIAKAAFEYAALEQRRDPSRDRLREPQSYHQGGVDEDCQGRFRVCRPGTAPQSDRDSQSQH